MNTKKLKKNTPLYENEQKWARNKSIETTNILVFRWGMDEFLKDWNPLLRTCFATVHNLDFFLNQRHFKPTLFDLFLNTNYLKNTNKSVDKTKRRKIFTFVFLRYFHLRYSVLVMNSPLPWLYMKKPSWLRIKPSTLTKSNKTRLVTTIKLNRGRIGNNIWTIHKKPQGSITKKPRNLKSNKYLSFTLMPQLSKTPCKNPSYLKGY